jgi:hypothetical protein
MSHIIQDFSKWKKLNEQDVPGRERERGSNSNKVVAIPVDKTTLKLKVVNDADIIDAEGRLMIDAGGKPVGFNALINWIKSQGEIIKYYSTLNDLTNNIVVYSITKDNDRKQVIIFKIYSKTQLSSQDPAAKGINPQVQYVRQDELSKAMAGTILNSPGLNKLTTPIKSATDLILPIESRAILNSTDSKLIQFIVTVYNKIKKDPIVSNNPIMAKVKTEVVGKKLGPDTILFIKGVNAGFGILDAQFREDPETGITKDLYDKINSLAESKKVFLSLNAERLVESESTVILGFDVDKFIEVVGTGVTGNKTGGIVVPPDGFRYGIRGDVEFKKFQDILVAKLPTYAGGAVAKHAPVANFIKAVPMKGDYGDRTKLLIQYLKVGLTNPTYNDHDAQVVKADFVERMLREFSIVTENTQYIGLDGFSLVVEGFDAAAADQYVTATSTVSTQVNTQSTQSTALKSPKEYTLPGKSYTYKAEGGFWKFKTGNTWTKVANPASIKELMAAHPKTESGGNYMIVPVGDFDKAWADSKAAYIYKKSGDAWQWSTPGPAGWTTVTDKKSLEYLNKYYGGVVSPTSTTSKSSTATVGKLSADQFNIIKPKIEAAIESAGRTDQLTEAGVVSQTDGITWKFSDPVNSYKLGTTGLITGKDYEDKQFISGNLSTDYSKVVLSSGITVSLKDFLLRTTSADLNKRKLSDIKIVELAGDLDTALMRANTDENTIMVVYRQIKTYTDLVALHKQFTKITKTGKNLLGALNGDLSNSEFDQLMEILDNNGLLGSTIYTNDGALGYKKMYAIASAAK